jgi:hypothetical protein
LVAKFFIVKGPVSFLQNLVGFAVLDNTHSHLLINLCNFLSRALSLQTKNVIEIFTVV